jgi:hypothetical protein
VKTLLVPAAFALFMAGHSQVYAAPASVADAYAACVNVIRLNLAPTSEPGDIEFAAVDEVNWTSGDEFYFAFSSGTISNASRSKADWLTGSMRPSASCIGSLSARSISSVSVNGADVTFEEGF